MKKILFLFLLVLSLSLVACGKDKEETKEEKTEEVKDETSDVNKQIKEIYRLASKAGYTGTYEEWLASIKGDEIILQVSNGYIQWKYSKSNVWTNLISLSELAGQKGADGKNVELRVQNDYIQWRNEDEGNNSWKNLIHLSSLSPNDGKTPEMRVHNGYIQWKYTTDLEWMNLVEISSVSEKETLIPEFKSSETHLLWKYTVESDTEWKELLDLESLKGTNGINGLTPEFRINEGYLEWKYTTDSEWVQLFEISNSENSTSDDLDSDIIDGLEWSYVSYKGKECVKIVNYTGTEPELVIPSHINGKEVIDINNIYNIIFGEDNETVTKIVIPNTVRRITALYGYGNLTEVIFEEGSQLEEIAAHAFGGCDNIENITIPSTVKRIGNDAFSYANIENLTISSDFEYLGEDAFHECKFETITINKYLDSFDSDDSIFFGCEIGTVAIGEGMEDLCLTIFEDTYIDKVYIPTTIKSFNNLDDTYYVYVGEFYFNGSQEEVRKIEGCVYLFELSWDDEINNVYAKNSNGEYINVCGGPYYSTLEGHYFICYFCGKEFELEEHTYDEGELIKSPTCHEVGLMEYTCVFCEYIYEEEIETTDHIYDTENWAKDSYEHFHKCLYCDSRVDRENHGFIDEDNKICGECGEVVLAFVEENYAHGAVSYVASSYDERAEILGILEKYAVKNNLTGLTLYENGSNVLYHPSIVKGTDNYIPGFGFAILSDGYITYDLEGETNPVWKRYYHTYQSYDPATINYMNSKDSSVGDISNYVTTTYFGNQLNETKDGYTWTAFSSNSERPEAVNGVLYDETVLATKYRFEVKVGSEFRYNTLSTIPSIAAFNGREVQLEDYITPYKIYYTQYYRMARGSESLTGTGSIKGSEAYYYASANGFNQSAWDDIGIKAYYENGKAYLEFEFNTPCNQFYAMYYLSSNMFAPVPEEFIKVLGNGYFDSGVKTWGNYMDYNFTPVDTWLSTGPYTLELWDSEQQIVFKKNPYYNIEGTDKYQIAGVHMKILKSASEDANNVLKEFEANRLHSCGIPVNRLEEYKDDPRTTTTVGSSTFKLNYNSCTQEEWIKLFGTNGSVTQTEEYNYWQCEPFMSNDDFLKGLSYSINRVEYAYRLGRTPSNNYFSSSYLSDPENGIMYNDTQYHKDVMAELSEGTEYGYNIEYAVASFKKAAEALIADGTYSYGDTVTIEFAWMYPSDEYQYHEYIKEYILNAWNAADTGLILNIEYWVGSQWNDVYYNKMMVGQFDIGFGSVSGNTLNPLNFLEVLKSDNSSGLTLNWGCDTSVVSEDLFFDGMYWSFDSLWMAADQGGYFEKGQLVPAVHVAEELEYIDNGDTATLIAYIDVAQVDGIEIEVDDAKVFSYIIAGSGYNYAEESVEFEYSDGVLIATLTKDQLAKYRDNCYYNNYGYVGLDVYYTVYVNGIPSSTFSTVNFTWPE